MEGDQANMYLLHTDAVIQGLNKFALRGRGNECHRFDAMKNSSPEGIVQLMELL